MRAAAAANLLKATALLLALCALARAAGLTYAEHRRGGTVVTANCGLVRVVAENGAIRRLD